MKFAHMCVLSGLEHEMIVEVADITLLYGEKNNVIRRRQCISRVSYAKCEEKKNGKKANVM